MNAIINNSTTTTTTTTTTTIVVVFVVVMNRGDCQQWYRLVGLVVKASASRAGSNPASAGIFSGSSHTSDLKIGTPVATLPGAWRYTVSTGTGRPGVSIL